MFERLFTQESGQQKSLLAKTHNVTASLASRACVSHARACVSHALLPRNKYNKPS